MGTLKSTTSQQGKVVNGVTLGVPAIDTDGSYIYDHHGSRIPTGRMLPDGTPINAWVQPLGASLGTYALNQQAAHNGKIWRSLVANNVWEPGVANWIEVAQGATAPAWIQPTGAQDAYPLNALVTHNGQTWRNTGSAANVWEPGVFGWVVVP